MSHIVLQADHLTKRYGSLVAVKDLSLEVYEGEVFGFLGPNGAGKTTSINMMCGLLKPDAGRVLVLGQPITDSDARTRTRVGMCPQATVFWDRLTCLEQLQFIGEMYGLRAREARQRAEQLLVDLELVDKRNQQARTLSGGMQRRLSLALALVHRPDVIVLDEPEAGLDPQSRIKVREYIRSLARQATVILTTHNMDEADRVADRIAIIDHGELLVLDAPEALKRRVGAGDVVEIDLSRATLNAEQIPSALTPFEPRAAISLANDTLTVRALNVLNLLPEILETLSACGVHCGEVHLRENTLEDVFIQLTGRRLRE